MRTDDCLFGVRISLSVNEKWIFTTCVGACCEVALNGC